MGAIVLHYDLWPLSVPARALGDTIAGRLGVRVVPIDRRPHIGMYDVVTLVVPVVGLLDPRIQLMAADGELTGKTVALVTDAPGPWPEAFFLEWTTLASLAGGARLYGEPLHLGAWPLLGAVDDATRARAQAWADRLAEVHPTPTYPRGDAGRRQMGR